MGPPNPLGIGQCLWGTAFTNPARGCRKPKGHTDAHDLYGQTGIPGQLKTREEQEAWAAAHAPPWELDRERFQRRLDERARAFSKRDPKPVDRVDAGRTKGDREDGASGQST
jgi:hypothetical protein